MLFLEARSRLEALKEADPAQCLEKALELKRVLFLKARS